MIRVCLAAACLMLSPAPSAGAFSLSSHKRVVQQGLREATGPAPTSVHRCLSGEFVVLHDTPQSPQLRVAVARTGFLPKDVTRDQLEAALTSAARVWARGENSCGFEERDEPQIGFRSADAPFDPYDGVNTVGFSAGCASENNIACTYLRYDEQGRLEEWDIIISPAADFSAAGYALEQVILHELGHVYGLGDVFDAAGGCASTSATLTMSGCTWPGERLRTPLGKGDVLGLREVGK